VCRSAARRTKTSISKKQNEKITAAMALGPVRLSLRIATTASRCRVGHKGSLVLPEVQFKVQGAIVVHLIQGAGRRQGAIAPYRSVA
jgi:hypothetical protein